MDPMGVPAFAATESLATDHDQEASDKVRGRLLSLLESEDYSLYDSSGKRLNDLPTPRRLAETKQLKPVQTGKILKLDKKRLGQLLNKKYDRLLNPVPAQTKKSGPSLSDPDKNFLDDLLQQHGPRRLYDELTLQPVSPAVRDEDQSTAVEDHDGTNFGVGSSVVTREAPVGAYQGKDPTMPQRALPTPPVPDTVQGCTEEMNVMEEKQDANESNNPETTSTENSHPWSSVNVRKNILLAPCTLPNIDMEVDLNVKEENLDTVGYSDPLTQTASKHCSSQSSHVSEINEDLDTSRYTNPETASTRTPFSNVSENDLLSEYSVPSTEMEGFTGDTKGKAEELDTSKKDNSETGNRHHSSPSFNVNVRGSNLLPPRTIPNIEVERSKVDLNTKKEDLDTMGHSDLQAQTASTCSSSPSSHVDEINVDLDGYSNPETASTPSSSPVSNIGESNLMSACPAPNTEMEGFTEDFQGKAEELDTSRYNNPETANRHNSSHWQSFSVNVRGSDLSPPWKLPNIEIEGSKVDLNVKEEVDTMGYSDPLTETASTSPSSHVIEINVDLDGYSNPETASTPSSSPVSNIGESNLMSACPAPNTEMEGFTEDFQGKAEELDTSRYNNPETANRHNSSHWQSFSVNVRGSDLSPPWKLPNIEIEGSKVDLNVKEEVDTMGYSDPLTETASTSPSSHVIEINEDLSRYSNPETASTCNSSPFSSVDESNLPSAYPVPNTEMEVFTEDIKGKADDLNTSRHSNPETAKRHNLSPFFRASVRGSNLLTPWTLPNIEMEGSKVDLNVKEEVDTRGYSNPLAETVSTDSSSPSSHVIEINEDLDKYTNPETASTHSSSPFSSVGESNLLSACPVPNTEMEGFIEDIKGKAEELHNNPETTNRHNSSPSFTASVRGSNLVPPWTLPNIEMEGSKVDLEEELDTREHSDSLTQTANTCSSSPSSHVIDINEDLDRDRYSNPETASTSTHGSSPFSNVSERDLPPTCPVPNIEMEGFTEDIKGKVDEPDTSRCNNPETANRHNSSPSSSVSVRGSNLLTPWTLPNIEMEGSKVDLNVKKGEVDTKGSNDPLAEAASTHSSSPSSNVSEINEDLDASSTRSSSPFSNVSESDLLSVCPIPKTEMAGFTKDIKGKAEELDTSRHDNPETANRDNSSPSFSVNVKGSNLLPSWTLPNIEIEGSKVDLNVKQEEVDTMGYSDPLPLAEIVSTGSPSPSSKVTEINEDLDRYTKPETASTHSSSLFSNVSERVCPVPNIEMEGFTEDINGKVEEPDTSRYNNPETANGHNSSPTCNVSDMTLPRVRHSPQPVVGVKLTDKTMSLGTDHDIIDLTADDLQPPEVYVISTDESDVDEPKPKVPRSEATVPKQDDGLDINDNSGICRQAFCTRTAFEPEQSSSMSLIAEQSDHDASHEERASVDNTEIPRELPIDLTHNFSSGQVKVARQRVAQQEGREAQKRFAESLSVPGICRNVSRGPRYVYVSANLDVCLNGKVDILQGNYMFEVKHSMSSLSKKKLGKEELRECLFYMVLCQVDCAFFVVEQSKKIFVVQYDEDAFQEIERRAMELATFMDKLAGQQ